jgi:8-oxo-dGTP pyrophosphatase MutT (NUDIX family)
MDEPATRPRTPLPPRYGPRQRLPAEIVERARAYPTGPQIPVPVRDAATVVLLRDGADGVEACTLRRAATMAFAANMHVFPGGTVDPADNREDIPWIGPPVEEIAHALGAGPALTRGLVCAAVRETFEESGVLLAGASPASLADTSAPSWRDDRRALEEHRLGLAELLRARSLALRADMLRPWARWVTPVVEPRRYDTRFFVARMPPGQVAEADGMEAKQLEWMRPVTALEREEEGAVGLLPPTAFTLAELAEYDSVDAVMAAAAIRDLAPVMPKILITDGEAHLLLPHDEAYEQA